MIRVSTRALFATLVLGGLVGATSAHAQQVLLDKPVKAGELTVFPDLNDENVYYYVSDKLRLATSAEGLPQFSFIRWVQNVRSAADQPEAREGEGGGLVHALVSLSVSREQLADGLRELQRLKPGGQIRGPVIFKSGKFALVCSSKDAGGTTETKVLGVGTAPILDGEKAAISMLLTRKAAQILWETFKTPTPDISFSFEMEMKGFRSPQRAVIEADFDRIYAHQAFGVGLASKYLAAEIRGVFDELQRSGAIKVTQVGDDAKQAELIATAYNKLSEMMFEAVPAMSAPGADVAAGAGDRSLMDRAAVLLAKDKEEKAASGAGAGAGAGKDKPKEAGKETGKEGGKDTATKSASSSGQSFAIVATYEMKKVHQRGLFRIDLNKFTSDSLTLRFDENVGDLRSLMKDAQHFRELNYEDPLYLQREIVVALDGTNAQDFGQYVNFVTVRLRKKHAKGAITDDEVRIDRQNFNKEGNRFKLLYGWNGDTDRARWMDYEYQTVWSFFGGRTVEEPFRAGSEGAINLFPPLQRRSVEVQADAAALSSAGVRSVAVTIFDDASATAPVRQVTLNPAKLVSQPVDLIVPASKTDYAYEIVWQLRGDRTVASGRKTGTGAILFADQLPPS